MSKKPILIILLIWMCHAEAEIYKWIDQDGQVQFGDRPPLDARQKAEPVELRINTYEAPEIVYVAPLNKEVEAKRKKVVMYSAEWCGVCKRAERYFKASKIPFREYDVEKSEKGRKDYRKMQGRGVPIILVGKSRMNGFSVSNFEKLYGSW